MLPTVRLQTNSVAFLAAVAASRPPQSEIHGILDNLSPHKTKRVSEFLSLHPNVHLHFIPTYFSWLNQGELSEAN